MPRLCDDRRHICAEPKAASRNTARFTNSRNHPKVPIDPQAMCANFGFKRGTRIIALLVFLRFRITGSPEIWLGIPPSLRAAMFEVGHTRSFGDVSSMSGPPERTRLGDL
jgi:hypothetical protein